MTHPGTSAALPDGIITPLVTLLDASGDIDVSAMTALVDSQVASGIDGVLSAGSTGELGTLGAPLRLRSTEVTVQAAAGRIPVWAGVAGLSTDDAVIEAREAQARGADALLVLPPLYFTHSDDELRRHFEAIRAIDLPIIAYDVPPRTPQKLSVALLARLAHDGAIDGVKDSSGDLTSGRLLRAAIPLESGFKAYAGSEITLESVDAIGFQGVVPGFANFAPVVFAELWRVMRNGDRARAWELSSWVSATFGIIGVPWAGAGGPAQAIAALKVATAWALELPLAQPMGRPFEQIPSAEFCDGVTEILDRAMASGSVEHVAFR
ncbi:dihydrodipicolinate synthase family protein [Salinibacterium sp. M195]|uniref:dihydrodipicolinate synthase family protein n=1 Tax=Salinibacterium sp. M195 TaxID=2583374 RepID=UPI001C63B3D6|nr:dihydrodipicolinate synthase family protein [Salinibacterium sp. M195]QYH35272.1 dihydrodipicolinate synthase family protein [Salinibacterium sp. M195]